MFANMTYPALASRSLAQANNQFGNRVETDTNTVGSPKTVREADAMGVPTFFGVRLQLKADGCAATPFIFAYLCQAILCVPPIGYYLTIHFFLLFCWLPFRI